MVDQVWIRESTIKDDIFQQLVPLLCHILGHATELAAWSMEMLKRKSCQ